MGINIIRPLEPPIESVSRMWMIDYNDDGTSAFVIQPDEWTTVNSNGLGAFGERQAPVGYEFWDTSDGKFIFTNIPELAWVKVRVAFTIGPALINSRIDMRLAAFSGATPLFDLTQKLGQLNDSAGLQVPLTFVGNFYVGPTLKMPGIDYRIQMRSTYSGNVVINGIVVEKEAF